MARLKKFLMEYLTMFFIGGLFYYLTEVIVRGYSHFTMLIAGGLIFILIGNKVGVGIDKPDAFIMYYYNNL